MTSLSIALSLLVRRFDERKNRFHEGKKIWSITTFRGNVLQIAHPDTVHKELEIAQVEYLKI
jgi:hypothetical protein